MDKLECIISFVEGRIIPSGFRDAIYNDDYFEEFFRNSISILPYGASGEGIYLYMILPNCTYFNNCAQNEFSLVTQSI